MEKIKDAWSWFWAKVKVVIWDNLLSKLAQGWTFQVGNDNTQINIKVITKAIAKSGDEDLMKDTEKRILKAVCEAIEASKNKTAKKETAKSMRRMGVVRLRVFHKYIKENIDNKPRTATPLDVLPEARRPIL